MDALVELINTFTKSDVNDFTSFIHRMKQKEGRKDLQLFQYLYKNREASPNEIIKHIYPDDNKEAYHALRKKLYKHLNDFIYHQQVRNDYTLESQINAQVSMARYLKEHNIMGSAWKYLQKAEKMAVGAEHFALANNIVSLQLDMPIKDLKQDLKTLLARKQRYLRLAVEDEHADTAYKIIKHLYREAKVSTEDVDLEKEVEWIFEQYQLNKALSNRPSVVYKLMSILRSVAASNKDYYHFEPLLLSYYNQIDAEAAEKKSNRVIMARLQYMVAHTLFRNKKFAESIQYLKILRESLRTLVKTEYVRMLPKLTQLYGANLFFTGKISDAIRIVDANFTEKLSIQQEDSLNLKLNQSIYHFFNHDYRQAAKVLASVGHSNAWCAKVAGIEWVVKKDMLDVFIQFELGHYEIASNRVRALLRQKGLFRNQPQYERVEVFIKLIGKIVEDPEVAQSKDFYDEVEESFDWQPIAEEDLHASVFYTWLKAKLLGRDCYEVLLELISIYQ
ncbi:hypothetical protein [Carboxylicivirga caseinilyticus]|uniref:hypothetical protein n=1 Tax=Carboxylicivirga caseinilyticus TaxID=3417572 RepID=UPI003D332EAD|nr:hypothetical protein [Marinilabiliaceae bacterium A049]